MASTSWILHTLWPVVIKCDCFVSSQVGTIFVNSGKHVYWQLLNNNMLYYGINNKISRGIISLISLKATLTFLKHFYWSKLYTLADSGFFKNFLYQGGVTSTVSWVFEDLKLKISESSDQNWCFPGSAQLAVSAQWKMDGK